MKISFNKAIYEIKTTSKFDKELKSIYKQGKDLNKLIMVVNILATDDKLDEKYKDHSLISDKHYKNCRECHIEPDWLLVYRKEENELILLLVETGSHSKLFNK